MSAMGERDSWCDQNRVTDELERSQRVVEVTIAPTPRPQKREGDRAFRRSLPALHRKSWAADVQRGRGLNPESARRADCEFATRMRVN